MKISNYNTPELEIEHFEICRGEAWCFIGANTSGISSLVSLFTAVHHEIGENVLTEKPEVISFAKQQEIFEEELRLDNTDFLDRIDPGTLAREFIENIEQHGKLIHKFNLQDCLRKGYRQLSSGESRKLILLKALSHEPQMIVFENPYDGLDTEGCQELDNTLAKLSDLGLKIIITVNNSCDIPSWCTHLAIMDGKQIKYQGLLTEILPEVANVMEQSKGASFQLQTVSTNESTEEELVFLIKGFARYGDLEIFSQLTLRVMSGQHTLISGPNGSGKSTLLQIITGDNQNCYANELHIFGIRRGTGESIWDLKSQMGIVTPDIHRNYHIPGSALQVVLSGFFDSIGVYAKFTENQKEVALQWLEMIGLSNHSQTSFRQLSYAKQRLCLIARSLIKNPRLLILDEPTQGLDQKNRTNLLNFLELIAEKKVSTILYASHRRDEFRSFFKQQITLT